jgi:hypothetical protein
MGAVTPLTPSNFSSYVTYKVRSLEKVAPYEYQRVT